jgi:hypothetical protein
MNPKHVREIQTNEVLRKRLAKYMALLCFRNTDVLEDLHSGEVPVSEAGDYSDVKVVTPVGEILPLGFLLSGTPAEFRRRLAVITLCRSRLLNLSPAPYPREPLTRRTRLC